MKIAKWRLGRTSLPHDRNARQTATMLACARLRVGYSGAVAAGAHAAGRWAASGVRQSAAAVGVGGAGAVSGHTCSPSGLVGAVGVLPAVAVRASSGQAHASPTRSGQGFRADRPWLKRAQRGLYAGKQRGTGNNVSFSQRK